MALTSDNLLFLTGVLLLVAAPTLAVGAVFINYINNRRSPIIAAPARVVAKRAKVSVGSGNYARTSYFVTFEDEFEDRREWEMAEEQYGLLVEGDKGTLTYQGEWFKGFTRNNRKPEERRAE